ncbi:type IV secretion system DNA-binding domain-containing protein [bacterium]|nr:type IV secretion system DNA-binding domain-containing protein [bacterium]
MDHQLELGKTTKTQTPITISLKERKQGTYVIGTTGTGKSTFLKNIVYQDMTFDKDHGLCVLDPHGDLIDDLLAVVPEDRKDDVILFDPYDLDFPFGLNLMECDTDNPHEVRWVVSNMMGTLERLFDSWGPRMEHVIRYCLLTALTYEDATMFEFARLLSLSEEEQDYLAENLESSLLKDFWRNFPKNPRLRYELIASTQNKLTPFVTDEMMRNIVGQTKSTINFKEIMDEGKILFVNLSKGNLGEANSKLLGSVIVNQILMAALRRKDTPEDDRKQFHLIVDEFQNFATESFAILQSEARKYGVDVVVAHQYRSQLDLLSLGSTLNVGNMVIFRVTGRDSYELASQFDNTPPAPDVRMEPVYEPMDYQGYEFFFERKLSTGEGGLHREVELPRRAYNDVEAEMANKLSILPDYYAWCRLQRKPEKPDQPPSLFEARVKTEHMTVNKARSGIAGYIKKRSQEMAPKRADVEKEILNREFKIIQKPLSSTAEKKR